MVAKTLIIIPARSGSKGIVDKNIKHLGGKPLLAWTAEMIKAAALTDCVSILSTDSARYAEIGKACGLAVPFIRPAACAQDHSASFAVVEHALQWFFEQFAAFPAQVMLLQPTSPFRPPQLLQTALDLMQNEVADSVIACKAIERDLTTLFQTEAGFLQPLAKNKPMQTQRQGITPLLTPNGALYLCKTELLLKQHTWYGQRTLPLLMTGAANLDIDTLTDWAMAEAFVQAQLEGCV